MTLGEKKEYKNKNWNFFYTYSNTQELLLSNDGKYIFYCKFELGNFEADYRNLHRS